MADNVMERARAAKDLLDNSLLQEVFDQADELFVNTWREAETVAEREMVWYKMTALDEVKRVLRGLVDRGKWEVAKGNAQW